MSGGAPVLPTVNVSDPATFGTHLSYMSAELHKVDQKLDAIGDKVGAVLIEMAKMPSTFATNATVQEQAKRIDQIEQRLDRDITTAPTVKELTEKVSAQQAIIDRMRGGYTWLWTAYGATLAAAGVVIAVIKLAQ